MVANANGMATEVELEIVSQLKRLREEVNLLADRRQSLMTRLHPLLATPKPQAENKDQGKTSELCPLGGALRDITNDVRFVNYSLLYLLENLQI